MASGLDPAGCTAGFVVSSVCVASASGSFVGPVVESTLGSLLREDVDNADVSGACGDWSHSTSRQRLTRRAVVSSVGAKCAERLIVRASNILISSSVLYGLSFSCEF